MVGPRTQITSFDAGKTIDWLNADIVGFMYTWAATVAVAIVGFILVYAIFGIDLVAPVSWLNYQITILLGARQAAWIMVAMSALPAYIRVFLLRRNFCVIGSRRDFSYVARFRHWLRHG